MCGANAAGDEFLAELTWAMSLCSNHFLSPQRLAEYIVSKTFHQAFISKEFKLSKTLSRSRGWANHMPTL